MFQAGCWPPKKESKTLTAGFSSCLLCGWAPGSWVSLTARAAPHTAHCRTGLSYSPSPGEAVSALQYLIFHYSLSNQLFCGSWSRMLLIADTYQANCPFLHAQEHLKMVLQMITLLQSPHHLSGFSCARQPGQAQCHGLWWDLFSPFEKWESVATKGQIFHVPVLFKLSSLFCI